MILYCLMFGAIAAFGARSITHSRSGRRPSAARRLKRSMTSGGEPASSNVVIPFDKHSSAARSISRSACVSRSAAVRLARSRFIASRTRPWARSFINPIGLPSASFMISPPGGSAVFRVMPARAMAAAFAKLAWPLACVSSTGLFGETRLSELCTGKP